MLAAVRSAALSAQPSALSPIIHRMNRVQANFAQRKSLVAHQGDWIVDKNRGGLRACVACSNA